MYAMFLMKLKYQKTSNIPCQSDEFLHEKVVHKLGSTAFKKLNVRNCSRHSDCKMTREIPFQYFLKLIYFERKRSLFS